MLALWALTAPAASLAVGELKLEYAAPWQRGDAEAESRAESVILHRSDATQPLMVMLPRHQPRLRMPEEHFYRQLEMVWRHQYGEAARLDWLKTGDRRWRILRRPSLDRAGAVVFHLVTVIDGRAHHLLAYAPASTAELPEAIIGLLSAPAGTHGNGETPAASAAAQAPPPPPAWRLARTLRIQPGPSALDQVMAREQRGLRADGGISGIALEVKEHGLEASLQGFVWVPGPARREVRREFTQRWELAWTAPPQLWRDDEAAAIRVSSGAGSDRVGLGIGLRHLCGGAAQLRELLAAVEGAQGDVSERIEAGGASCRGRVTGLTWAEVTLGAGETARPILIQPPVTAVVSADEQALLVLTLQPRVAEGRPGHSLLQAAAVHYVYVRAR